jgi:hypothetical protein
MGAADGQWVRKLGITDVTCVDWDDKTLEPFKEHYPKEWTYVLADAFDWARKCGRTFDLVSADMPSQYGDAMLESIPLWCALSNRYVTMTVMQEGAHEPHLPKGWLHLTTIERNTDPIDGRTWWWLVLVKEEERERLGGLR